MTKQELLDLFEKLSKSKDPEGAHADADDALLEYIGDEEITKAFNRIPMWYA